MRSKGPKLTKREKITIVTAVTVVLLLTITFVLVILLVFMQPTYKSIHLGTVKQSTILFEDDFNGDTLDDKKWNVLYNEPIVRRGGYWSANQVFTDNGNMVIRTEKVGTEYHTGAVDTSGKFDQKYGYFEARCKLPQSYGIWSAFWLFTNKFGVSNGVDSITNANIYGAEIDIFEAPYRGGRQLVQQGIHTGGYGASHFSSFNPNWIVNEIPNMYTEFHTYGLYWDAEIYNFYVDDCLVWTTECYNNISQVPQFMMLTVEISGEGGVPGSFWGTGNISDEKNIHINNASDMDFLIDYVRVYDVSNI